MRATLYWLSLPLRRYATFYGRSRRQEFWPFTIATAVGSIGFDTIDELFALHHGMSPVILGATGYMGTVFSLMTVLPSLTVAVRRLHDIDRSGWWLAPLVAVIFGSFVAIEAIFGESDHPNGHEAEALAAFSAVLISFLVMVILFCRDGTSGPNRFGENPKGVRYDGVFD